MATTDQIAAGFPRELLSRSKRERREYFHDYTILHTSLKTACDELLSAILDTADRSLIFLAGPTGVGKTTLIRFLEARLTKYLTHELEKDKGRLACVTLEVPAPESSVFPWRDLYRRALLAMNEPLIGYKINVPARPTQEGNVEVLARTGRGNATQDLRHALESVLRHRRPLVCVLDEGQHLMKIASGRKLRDQLDVIKSTANMSKVPHLLTGTYDLLPFINLSGQLSRCTTVVHLPRYQNTVLEDATMFSAVLRVFQRHLPIAEEPDLVGQAEYMYQHSIGCIGVLKNWLGRALNLALNEDATTLTMAHLKKRALSSAQCLQMLSEAQEGESKMADDDANDILLQKKLGMSFNRKQVDSVGVKCEEKSIRKQKSFQRKPGRDPVGQEDDHVS